MNKSEQIATEIYEAVGFTVWNQTGRSDLVCIYGFYHPQPGFHIRWPEVKYGNDTLRESQYGFQEWLKEHGLRGEEFRVPRIRDRIRFEQWRNERIEQLRREVNDD